MQKVVKEIGKVFPTLSCAFEALLCLMAKWDEIRFFPKLVPEWILIPFVRKNVKKGVTFEFVVKCGKRLLILRTQKQTVLM